MFTIKRSDNNPIISPTKEHPWEAMATFNWCPVKVGSEIHVVYRAISKKELLREPHVEMSIIGRAKSKDGKSFDERLPFITPEKDFEKFGCEDPRVTKLGSTYYIFYTALSTYPFSADGIKVAVALSKDMKTITERHLVTPFNAKAMTLFPEKINGKMAVLLTANTDLPPSRIAYAEFEKEEDLWSQSFWNEWYKNLESHTIDFRRKSDDQVEIGAPPIKTSKGWLIIYSHIAHYGSNNPIFGIEAILLDQNDPRKIIGRTKGPFLVPETYYERTGFVPNIVFPSGAIINGDMLDIYYGGADTHCAKASLPLKNLLNAIIPGSEKIVKKYPGNPIISPRENISWEASGTLNPAAIDLDGKIHIIYRAATLGNVSTLGYANTKDGFAIDERLPEPIYFARTDLEGRGRTQNAGCEDPRIVEINKKLYMTYSAYDGSTPRVAVSSISKKDFLNKQFDKWSLPQIISEPNIPNKDACIIPEKIGGQYYLFHRVQESICVEVVPNLDFTKEKINRCIEVIAPRRGMWDDKKVGIASPPLKTKKGWLLLYHGISEMGTYRVGAALLDLKNPTIVIARTAFPILEPEEDYELKGVVPKVVFPCGMVYRNKLLYIYYGAADSTVCVATAKLSDILEILKI